jgi:hypothetical protein
MDDVVRGEEHHEGEGVDGKNMGATKRMSKVDVLSRAARAIRRLESDYEKVRREVEILRQEKESPGDGSISASRRGAGSAVLRGYRWRN